MKTITLFLAQQPAAPGSEPQKGGFTLMLLVYGLMFAGLYFLVFAPQRKKQKDLEKMISTIEAGDQVVTTGGIDGIITSVKSDCFVIRTADSTKLEIRKGFIHAVVKKTNQDKPK